MSLADEVEARVETDWLVQLTNKDAKNATTINTTQLGLACTDVEGAFGVAGITLDVTDARHVYVAVRGVIAALRMNARTGGAGGSKTDEWDSWKKGDLSDLMKATSRARVTPVTTSQLTPSDEVQSGETRRPEFDESRTRRYVPSSHGSDDPYADD